MDENENTEALEGERLKKENDAMAGELNDLRERLAGRDAAFAPLRDEVEGLKARLLEKDEELKTLGENASGLERSLEEAVAAYREMVVRANTGVTAELVSGGTVEEVNASLERARGIVEGVRKSLEAERAEARIPAGSPPRTAPDLSSLSPIEKIKHAIGGK